MGLADKLRRLDDRVFGPVRITGAQQKQLLWIVVGASASGFLLSALLDPHLSVVAYALFAVAYTLLGATGLIVIRVHRGRSGRRAHGRRESPEDAGSSTWTGS